MNLLLKKISYSASLSEETSAYTADLYVDGVLFAHVSNDGHGGCDRQYPAKGKTMRDIDDLNNRIKAEYPKQTYKVGEADHSYDTDLEVLCGQMLGKYLVERDVKRDLAKKIMFVKPSDGKLYGVKIPNAAQKQQLIDIVKNTHKVERTLNEMPLADAVKVYESMGA